MNKEIAGFSIEVLRSINRCRWLEILVTILFVIFIVTFPRYTYYSRIFYFLLCMIALGHLGMFRKAIPRIGAVERSFFLIVLANFLWIAFTYYWNGKPGTGDTFVWGRHLYFLFLIPLYFLFRRVQINFGWVLLGLFGAALLASVDMLIDLHLGVDHRFQGMNPNGFGPVMLGMLGIMLFCLFYLPSRWQRLIALAGFMLAVIAIILSQSRGTWLSIPFLIIFFTIYLGTSISVLKKLFFAIVFSLFCAIAYQLPIVKVRIDAAISNLSAYAQSEHRQDSARTSSVGLRIELWRAAWQMFLDQPLTGVGLGNFQTEAKLNAERYNVNLDVENHKYVHNQYIAALATRGIIGFSLFVLVLILPVYIAMRSKTETRGQRIANLSIIFISIVYATGCLVEDHYDTRPAIMFLSMIMAYLLAGQSADRQPVNK